LDAILKDFGLPTRATSALYDATIGFRVRRSNYERDADLEQGTAQRDLRILVAKGLLVPQGETKGRTYVGGEMLRTIQREVAADRHILINPYGTEAPDLTARPRRSVITTN